MISGTQLDGVALVVGSGRGIGQQAAFSLAEAGAKAIVFADINEENAKASAEESKTYATNKDYHATSFKVDVTDEKGVQAMVAFVVDKFGRLDYAVNGAGIDNGLHAPMAETDIANFENIMNVNNKGLLLCVRAELAAMQKQSPKTFRSRNGTRDIGRGAIVNIASANSFAGLPGKGSYTISKHAAMGLTKMAGKPTIPNCAGGVKFMANCPLLQLLQLEPGCLDHAPEGIRCNAVCPTWVRTPLLDIELQKNPQVQGMISAVVPIKRAAECEEVADTIAFLCSPAASYINGTSLIVDAGATLTVRLV